MESRRLIPDSGSKQDTGMAVPCGLGALGLRIMEIVWTQGEVSIRDVWERLRLSRPVAFNTVMTVMNRLVRRGLLRRTGTRGSYRFIPALSRTEFASGLSREINRTLLRQFPTAAIAGFLESLDVVDSDMLAKLEAFIHQERVSRGAAESGKEQTGGPADNGQGV